VYGKCVAANYQNASKDMCAKEFMMLKDCYLVCIGLFGRDARWLTKCVESGWQEGLNTMLFATIMQAECQQHSTSDNGLVSRLQTQL